ncbi:MAG: hypothetical protein R3F60_16765 [bacterium]
MLLADPEATPGMTSATRSARPSKASSSGVSRFTLRRASPAATMSVVSGVMTTSPSRCATSRENGSRSPVGAWSTSPSGNVPAASPRLHDSPPTSARSR